MGLYTHTSSFSGSEKARTYVLAALMLLCEGEERHAAVVVRAGALPTLVTLAGGASAQESADGGSGSSHSASSRRATHAQEFSAAVLCCMSRYVDMQVGAGLSNVPGQHVQRCQHSLC